MKREIKKGQIVQFKGDTNTKIYFVETGLLRSYSIDEKGKEHIFMFAPEGWIIGDSCLPQENCELFIDAIEDSTVKIQEKDPNGDKDGFKLIKRLGVLQKRIIMLMCSTAHERYKDFLTTYPNIIPRLTQKMIASYIAITPEALSAIKNKNND